MWSTKNREPFLTPEVETAIYGYLVSKATGLDGKVYTIGGVEDHVHVVVSIPPAISVAKFVGQIKGVASTRFNKSGVSSVHFEWQDEYGAFSFDARRLPNFIAYAERQKEHHHQGTIIPLLERMTAEDVGSRLVREEMPAYLVEADDWRRDLLQY